MNPHNRFVQQSRIARDLLQRRCQSSETPFETVELQPKPIVRKTSDIMTATNGQAD